MPKTLFEKLSAADSSELFPPHFHLPLRQYALIHIGSDRILEKDEEEVWHKTSVIHYLHRKFGLGAEVEKIAPGLLSPAFLEWLNGPAEGDYPLPVTRHMFLVAKYVTPYDRLYNLKSEASVREFYADFVSKYAIAVGFPPGLMPDSIFKVLAEEAPGLPAPDKSSYFLSVGLAHIWRNLMRRVPFEPGNAAHRADFLTHLFHLMAMLLLDLRLLPQNLIQYLNAHVERLSAPGKPATGLMLETFRLAGVDNDPRWSDGAYAETMQRQFFREIYPTLILPPAVAAQHQKLAEALGEKTAPKHVLQQERPSTKFIFAEAAPAPKKPALAMVNLLERDEEYTYDTQATRLMAGALEREKIPFAYCSASNSPWAKQRDLHQRHPSQPLGSINLFQARLDDTADFMLAHGPGAFETRTNIGYCAWETSRLPETFKAALDLLDEIWAPSAFVRDLFINAGVQKPVKLLPLPVAPPIPAPTITRKSLNLPEKSFIFLTVFDALDWLSRKNPLGAVDAFQKAFPQRDDMTLVIKTRYIEKNIMSREEGHILRLLKRCENDPRIIFLNHDFYDDEMAGLIRISDAVVSLARCSGFGRFIAEAMALGKPVIATAGSGPADFASTETAALVSSHPSDVVFESYLYLDRETGHGWWEPDIKSAAEAMQLVAGDKNYAARIAAQGQKHIHSHYSEEVCAKALATRLKEIAGAARSLTHAA